MAARPPMKQRKIQIVKPELPSSSKVSSSFKNKSGLSIFYRLLLFLAFLISAAALYLLRLAS